MKKIVFIAFFMIISLGFFSLTYAAEPYSLLQPIPGIQKTSSITDYINRLVPFVIMLAAVLALVQIVVGGMEWALSEAISSKQEGKERITMALLGLLIALLSYLILNVINPDLVNLKDPSIPTVKGTSGSVGAGIGGAENVLNLPGVIIP